MRTMRLNAKANQRKNWTRFAALVALAWERLQM